MEVLLDEGRGLPPALWNSLARYRYDVFVRRLGWPLRGGHRHARPDEEVDEFDGLDTVYALALDQGRIRGCARLLPTTRPYLMQRHFAGLLDAPPPSCARIWELSRFACDTPAGAPGRHASILLRAVLQGAADRGARTLVGVTFASLERHFRRFGAVMERLGPCRADDGRAVVACAMAVPASLEHLKHPASTVPAARRADAAPCR